MNLSAPFIRRPVGTLLLTIGLALAGVFAFFKLPVAPLPDVDFPAIVVQATLPGASPSTMASTVASPLERHLGTIAGVSEMTSRSSVGSAQVVLIFDTSRDIDGAARDVEAAINASRADLPAALKTNPSYRKINPSEAPIMILSLSSKSRRPDEIYDAVSNIVQQKLLQVNGVGNVELGGAALPSVRVEVNPLALARAGIALEDVRTALQSASADRPRGVLELADSRTANGTAWQIYTGNAGVHARDYAPLVIASRNNAVVRLSDIATVSDGPEDVRTFGLLDGRESVQILVSRQPGANIVATVDALKAQLPPLAAALPPDIKLQIASDRTTTIRASLHEVELTLLVATLLVVLVVSLFLHSWHATLIPAAAVVASLLGTLGFMALAGFSLDNLSLMALTVATGFVVDDAIVVVENVARHVEAGMKPLEAAFQGTREVGFTVLSISLSLVAVFVPLIFMPSIIGRLFREFALTMTAAVLISLVVSLTATPMMAARLLGRTEKKNRVFEWAGAAFDKAQAQYARNLDWALANRGAVLMLLFGAMALNVYLIMVAPGGLFPQQDTGGVQGGIRADQSVSFIDLRAKMGQIVRIVKADPAVEHVVAFGGGTRAGGGFLFATLKPRGSRPGVTEVIQRLRPKLQRIRGVSLFLNPIQDLSFGGRQTTSTYQYVLQADDFGVLKTAGDRLVQALKKQPDKITDVDIDSQDAGADAFVTIDRPTAGRLGITAQTVDNTLYDAFGQRQVAAIYQGLNQYHVVMEDAPQFAGRPDALANIYLPTGQTIPAPIATSNPTQGANAGQGANAATGAAVAIGAETLVPLATIAHWATGSTNANVNHSSGEPSATVSFNLPPGVSLGTASKLIQDTQAQLGLPATVHGDFGGTAKLGQQQTAGIPILFAAAIACIYIVLGILYESAIHPITVLSTLPSAGVGAVLTLILTGGEMDVIAIIGIILLIGIVKKNAILIIDFAIDAQRHRGLDAFAAIREASLLRFRPILMTTLAAGFGALPLAIGFGDGAELRRPLGIAIIGGLIASQFLTLLTTPVVYVGLERQRGEWRALSLRRRLAVVAVPLAGMVAAGVAARAIAAPAGAALLLVALVAPILLLWRWRVLRQRGAAPLHFQGLPA